MKRLIKNAVLILSVLSLVLTAPAFSEEFVRKDSAGYVLNHPSLSKKISLDLLSVNVADAVRYLGDKADINVGIDKNVTGRVSITFKNVSVRDALDIILLSNQLAAEMRGEILYVMPGEEYENLHGEKWGDPRQVKVFNLKYSRPTDVVTVLTPIKSKVGNIIGDNESGTLVVMDSLEKIGQMKNIIDSMEHGQVTKVFDLSFAKAKDIETHLQTRLDAKGVGSIKADETNNRVVVTALPQKMKEAEDIIYGLDKKSQQVLIEAKIVEVTLSPDFDMGIDWEYIINKARNDMVDIAMNFPVSPALTSGMKLITGTLDVGRFETTIKILRTIGDTKILSSPRITVINNREAKILVGKREAYITNSVTQGSSTTTTADNVTFVDVGVSLYVTPTINPDGFITMAIRPEVSSVESYLTTFNEDETIRSKVPIIATANAETTVIAKEGCTIIIGGLIRDELLRTIKKLPGLGDIPYLGMAFRQTHEEKEKKELVVFLTPKIVTGDVNMTTWENKDIKGPRGSDNPK